MKKIFSFLAAVLFAGSMMATTVTKTVAELAVEKSFTNGEICTPFALDEVITVSTSATDVNTGKYYSNGEQVRLYQTGSATITLTAAEGYKISSVTLTYASQNTGILVEAESDVPVSFDNVQSATFTVGNSGTATNGQARITAFSVTYDADGGTTPDPEPEPEPVVADVDTVYDWAYNVGSTILGAAGVEISTVKIHTNTDAVNCLKFGSSYVYADGKWVAIKPAQGAFKAGDTLKVAAVFNNADDTKYAQVDLRAADGDTRIWLSDSASTINGRTSEADPIMQFYALEADQDSLFLGRYGNTGMNITFLQVVRAKAGDDEPVLADPTNCAEAAEAALSVENNNDLYNDGAEYTIEGYVTSIATPYNATYNNISFWMADEPNGGNVLEAYRAVCASADDAPAVGDKVSVTGKLTKYNSTPEFAAGCTYTIVEKSQIVPQNLGAKTIGEFLALKNTIDTCVLTGVVTSIVNTTYGNLYLAEGTDTLYIYGVLTPEGASKQFESLNVAEKDTLTIKAVYAEYQGAPQAKNAIFVEVKKAPKAPAQDIEVTLSSLTAPGSLIWTDATATSGWWQIMGESDSYAFSLSNAGEIAEAAGTFTAADLDADYSYISIYGEKDTTDVAFADGSVTVAVSAEGIVTVNGTLVGEDGNNYIFNLTYKDPTADNTVNVAIPEWKLVDDYVAYLGLFAVAGEDANGTYVQLALNMPDEATEIVGDYTEEDFDLQYFGSYVADANGAYRIFSATIKVTKAENGRVLVTADILCYNNTLYKVTTPAGQGISNTAVETKATKTLKNGQLIIEKAGVKYNAQGAVIR